jgi:hypothetical protein
MAESSEALTRVLSAEMAESSEALTRVLSAEMAESSEALTRVLSAAARQRSRGDSRNVGLREARAALRIRENGEGPEGDSRR